MSSTGDASSESPRLIELIQRHREGALIAADRLEELLPHLREVVNLVRASTGPGRRPYALLYEARRRLSRIVAPLGAGQPNPSGYDWDPPTEEAE